MTYLPLFLRCKVSRLACVVAAAIAVATPISAQAASLISGPLLDNARRNILGVRGSLAQVPADESAQGTYVPEGYAER
ncbi:hypothetical protein [Bordetella sp. 02P26C-1]|uniref:hypothetical protein n=1 Tax=Bordetella sp. 02P26C-1 TaxID=2683195 RepID=UPI0013553F3F|nr:hypothetical protein [Bordetella sp. 02P26C-1]MVW77329.1 hypothetical protein [Bordetella sp. 02P26C-1]